VQHLDNFLVGHNQKGSYKVAEEPARVSWFERLTIVVEEG
jgi:hypothetical protein